MTEDIAALKERLVGLHSRYCECDQAYPGGCGGYDAIAVSYDAGYGDGAGTSRAPVPTLEDPPVEDLPVEGVAVAEVVETAPTTSPTPVAVAQLRAFVCPECRRLLLYTVRGGRSFNECIIHGEVVAMKVFTDVL